MHPGVHLYEPKQKQQQQQQRKQQQQQDLHKTSG
jgi:hypothetical protein